jgi:hypothetical protein
VRISPSDISNVKCASEGIKALAKAPWVSSLTELNLSSNKLELKGIEYLVTGQFKNLRVLELRHKGLDDKSIKTMMVVLHPSPRGKGHK